MFAASNIDYDVADRMRGLGVGGIGALHLLARQSGLIEAIDQNLKLLKIHLPYHESDHVLNIAYNILSGGDCLEDLELLRNDEVYLDSLGAKRIPEIAQGLGKGITEFKKAARDVTDEIDSAANTSTQQNTAPRVKNELKQDQEQNQNQNQNQDQDQNTTQQS